jgi:LPXTG-site transpeptidase (sortase) family protein
VQPPFAGEEYRIVIEKLGVDAPVREYGLDENAVPEVPTGPDAKEVVAWYNFSAQPGTGSNAVFAGHVTWYGDAVFRRLSTLVPGDVIKLRGEDGTELVYTVTDVFSVDPNDPDSVRVMSATDTDMITLITCDGTFVDTNDPVFGGEYSSRLVVRAERTQGAAAGG